MPDGTHVKCGDCRGFGWTVQQVTCTTCKGQGCGQCREGKVPRRKDCDKCKGQGYIEVKPFKITYQ